MADNKRWICGSCGKDWFQTKSHHNCNGVMQNPGNWIEGKVTGGKVKPLNKQLVPAKLRVA